MSSTAISLTGLGILALLLAGYIGQNRLPPPKPKILGIDLGTTYSCIGYYEAIDGTPKVIKTPDGDECIPSVVRFESFGKVTVGFEALKKSDEDSSNVIYDSKRFIGRNFTKEQLSQEVAGYNFKVMLKEDSTVCFEVLSATNKTCVSPEQIGAYIVKYLKEVAEANISRPVELAVMSVPADFDQQQRNYTKLATKLAGINVLRIINEPTAAALAYGLHKRKGATFFMVIDIGGGTSDISILNIQGGMFITTAIAGNNHLGGQDFNQNLFDYFQAILENMHGQDIMKNSANHQKLRNGVEELKLDLTSSNIGTLQLHLTSQDGATFQFHRKITREEFEKLNEKLFHKVIELIDVVMNSSDIERSEIDEIVLVGGSTRIPNVRKIIGKYFGKDPNTSIDPVTAVIQGNAIQAGIIGGMWPLKVSAIEIMSHVKKRQVS